MVGLSDIPCVGKFVDRISDATIEALFRGLHYLFCYKELVNVLDSEIEKVNIQEGRVSTKCVQERTDGKIIEDHVLRWQTEVKEIQESTKDFSEKYKNRASWTCLKCLPIPKPLSRFRLGREAVFKATKATQLIESGKDLLANEIAHLPPTENLPRTDTEFQDFTSRKDAYGKLWEALVSEGSSLVLGIYGMPGVGKTRMMEQIWQEAMEKKIFKKVARANVGSEKLDIIQLQNQIAGHLDCHFVSQDSVESRASQLKNSLINGGKILIILDDVWSEIPIDDIIGTSFGETSDSKGSKILLTSRREDVCLLNKCKCPVHIKTLTFSEAWDLFQTTAGTCHIDSLQNETLAKQVCAKCAGLPLIIRAVAKALRFMSHHIWKDALQKLEKGNFENIAGIDPQVYACVRLSIDRLPEDAKLCLFLCSLFPEDADIRITTLIQFAIGSRLIPDGESTVRAMVDLLTISSLLLECDEKHITKLHDTIRDVARSIASTDSKYAFLQVRFRSRLPESAAYSTLKLLHLDVESDDARFTEDLVCTDLYTLWLHCNNHLQQFSGGFFSMFMNLRFLVLQNVHFLSEHFSLQPLDKLNMLIFDKCDMRETDVSLFPKNLRTLYIWGCDLPSPLDLPNLQYLQKLNIQQEFHKVIMVPNAISSLSSLEELHIPNGFSFSDDAGDIKPILDEISILTRLTSLKVLLSDFAPCQGTNIFFKLVKYHVSVGWRWNTHDLPNSTRIIELTEVKVKRNEALQSLLERAEEVTLKRADVDLSSICNINREAFSDLRDLVIESCKTMECLARISQDEIQHSHQPQTSFSKLTILKISGCSAMKYLFCKAVAKCLVQLQELSIYDCGSMEVIVMNEGTSDGEIINFSKLKRLELRVVRSLTSFYREKKEKHWHPTDKSDISCTQYKPLFDGMVAFPSLEYLRVCVLEDNITDIWGKHYSGDNTSNNIVSSSSFCKLESLDVSHFSKLESVIPVGMLHRLRNLEYLDISYCSSLKNVFPARIARDLIHLRRLSIQNCGMMTEVIGGGEEETTDDNDHSIILFPELTNLQLDDLENVTCFWCYHKVKFLTLEYLYLESCGQINLEAIELSSDQLKTLCIRGENQIKLPCKWKLHLYNLEKLKLRNCWWHDLESLCFPKLKKLEVVSYGGSALFTISGLRSLQQLRRLGIYNCALLEEIVEHAETETKNITLMQLYSISFSGLPNLKSFIHGANYECYMPALETVNVGKCGLSYLFTFSVFRNLQQLRTLKISECALLEEIVEDVRGDEHVGMDTETVTLLQLISVVFKDLPNLKSFIHGANYECYMPALRRVEVDTCGLRSLFTCSVLKNLRGLDSLEVSNCRLVEDIVEDGRGDEASDTNDKIITLIQLSTISLQYLPNLKSFSRTASYAFNMPNLHYLRVHRCPQLEYFTYLKTITESVTVLSHYRDWGKITDPNDYIIQNHKRESNSVKVLENQVGNKDHETEPRMVEEEQPLEEN